MRSKATSKKKAAAKKLGVLSPGKVKRVKAQRERDWKVKKAAKAGLEKLKTAVDAHDAGEERPMWSAGAASAMPRTQSKRDRDLLQARRNGVSIAFAEIRFTLKAAMDKVDEELAHEAELDAQEQLSGYIQRLVGRREGLREALAILYEEADVPVGGSR